MLPSCITPRSAAKTYIRKKSRVLPLSSAPIFPHGFFRLVIRASSAVSAPVVYSPQANVGWYRVSCVLIFRIRTFFCFPKIPIKRNRSQQLSSLLYRTPSTRHKSHSHPVPPNYIPHSPPRRRRMTLGSRPRTISCGLGRHQIGEQTELHKLYPSHPLYKSFAERNESLDSLVHKRPSPPFPSSHLVSKKRNSRTPSP